MIKFYIIGFPDMFLLGIRLQFARQAKSFGIGICLGAIEIGINIYGTKNVV